MQNFQRPLYQKLVLTEEDLQQLSNFSTKYILCFHKIAKHATSYHRDIKWYYV